MKSILSFFNPLVIFLANTPLHFLFSHNIVLLKIKGVRSGKIYTIPVSYLKTKSGIICMTQSSGMWWKNLRQGQQVEIQLAGKCLSVYAIADADDVGTITSALEKFCRNSRASAYFAKVSVTKGHPNEADILVSAPNHALIEITF